MPGLMTHYLFGTDVYNYISDDRIKNVIVLNKDAYNLGLQGPDFFSYDLSRSAQAKGFNYGRLMHTNQTGAFFLNLIKSVNTIHASKRDVATAYLYGYICHFALDMTAHPYISYMSEFKVDCEADRQLSERSHAFFETAVDTQMLLIKRGLTPDKLRRQDLIDIDNKNLPVISRILTYAFNRTYNQYTSSYDIASSIKNFRLINAFIQDDKGVKLSIMKFFTRNLTGSGFLNGLAYTDTDRIKWDVLNRNNTTWCLPWDNTATSTKSFVDLYDDAALLASKIINDADLILNFNMKHTDFLDKIGNKSYLTGVECGKYCAMKYFRAKHKEIVR